MFTKFSRNSKDGHAWSAAVCSYAMEAKVEMIPVKDVKFALYGLIELNIRENGLYLEPGAMGFRSFDAAEYLENMLACFMKVRTKGEARNEFEQKK